MEVRPLGWSSDNWATPWPVVWKLEAQYGKFDLDPCAEPQTAKAPLYYTKEDDGLTQPWFGKVFVNPPYSDPRPWCERAVRAVESREAELVVMLLPASTDTAWFHELVLPHAHLEFLRGRVRFLCWSGTPTGSPRTPSLVAVLRPEVDRGREQELCASASEVA
jgi:phage N-6-adenine-methyltransferase